MSIVQQQSSGGEGEIVIIFHIEPDAVLVAYSSVFQQTFTICTAHSSILNVQKLD